LYNTWLAFFKYIQLSVPTICSYICHYHPLNPSCKPGLQAFYFHLANQAGHDYGTMDASESAHQALLQEQRNAEAMILDALKYRPDVETILASIDYSNFLIWNVPSLEVPMSMVESIRSSPLPGTVQLLPLCWLHLRKIHFRLDEYTKAVDVMKKVEEGFKQLNQTEAIARTHIDLAEVRRINGHHEMAVDLYLQAYSKFETVGSSCDMSACLWGVGIVHLLVANIHWQYRHSPKLKTHVQLKMSFASLLVSVNLDEYTGSATPLSQSNYSQKHGSIMCSMALELLLFSANISYQLLIICRKITPRPRVVYSKHMKIFGG
jgi:tetratricopeptide (TPR) repeat protein